MHEYSTGKILEEGLEELDTIFYCGSPNAKILVVSEAPTTSKNGKKTLHQIIQDPDKGEEFRRKYPFSETTETIERNTLYKVFVDNILDCVENKKDNIGFTDISKEPLDEKDLERKLEEEKEEEPWGVLKKQIEYVEPEIVVCNKKNVSILMDKYFGSEKVLDYEDRKIETSKEITLENNKIRLIFSSTAHIQMSKFSRERVSKEIKKYLD